MNRKILIVLLIAAVAAIGIGVFAVSGSPDDGGSSDDTDSSRTAGYTYTAVQVEGYKDEYQTYLPDDGKKFVLIDGMLKNNGRSSVYCSVFDFKLTDDAGRTYEHTKSYMGSGYVEPGKTMKISILFTVKEDAAKVTLKAADSNLRNSTGTCALSGETVPVTPDAEYTYTAETVPFFGTSYPTYPEPGKKLVEVHVTLKNTDADSISTNPMYYSMLADGIEYSHVRAPDDIVNLKLNSTGTFTLVFSLPESCHDMELVADYLGMYAKNMTGPVSV